MADDARPDDSDSTEEIVDLIAVDPPGTEGAVTPPPPPPSPTRREPAANRPRVRRRSRGWRSILVMASVWCVGGVLGTGIAIVLLWYGFGRDPLALFASKAPPVETAQDIEGPLPAQQDLEPSQDEPGPSEDPPSEEPGSVSPPESSAEADAMPQVAAGEQPNDSSSEPTEVATTADAPADFENSVGMKMVYLRPGDFLMGTDRLPPPPVPTPFPGVMWWEAPRHPVKISKGFYLSAHETTNAQYRQYLKETGAPTRSTASTLEHETNPFADRTGRAIARDASRLDEAKWRELMSGDDQPVLAVSWDEAVEFAAWLSRKEGRRYRLPTEAEWEYACRAGSERWFSFGDDPEALPRYGNASGIDLTLPPPVSTDEPPEEGEQAEAVASSQRVGLLQPNAFGLYDMHGNAAEWCADLFGDIYYRNSPLEDPPGATMNAARVVRGGSYDSIAAHCRSAYRSSAPHFTLKQTIGFRLACDLEPESATEKAIADSLVETDDRYPVPAPEVLAAATKKFEETFGSEMERAATPEAKVELAQKIYEQSQGGTVPPEGIAGLRGERYVNLNKSLDVALEAGDYPAARRATNDLTRAFAVDRLAVEGRLISALVEAPRSRERRGELLADALALGQALLEARRFPEVAATTMTARRLAIELGDVDAVSHAKALESKAGAGEKAWSVAQAALEELKRNPDDPAANLVYGRYLCLFEDDWEKGVVHLAKSDDEAIREAAKNELVPPDDLEGRVARADAWFELPAKEPLRYRARYWYVAARNAVVGPERALLDRRIEELDGRAPVVMKNSIGMQMALIPPGESFLGAGPELANRIQYFDPKFQFEHEQRLSYHRVRIERPFYMGVHEVTKGQFETFVRETNYVTDAESGPVAASTAAPRFTWRQPGFSSKEDHPVVLVSWKDAKAFAVWLSRKEGRTYRLPTQAEWEYACRAGSEDLFSFGDDFERLALFGNGADARFRDQRGETGFRTIDAMDGFPSMAPVGSFATNAFGLHDMHGNAAEWCVDYYEPGRPKLKEEVPFHDESYFVRGLPPYRGGSWSASPATCVCALRYFGHSVDARYSDVGFRLVLIPRDADVARLVDDATETPPAPVERVPPPAADAVEEAEAKLRNYYAIDDADTELERAAKAVRLLQAHDEGGSDPVETYALLRLACQLGVETSDFHVAETATEELLRLYVLDEMAERENLFKVLEETSRTPTERRYLGRCALRLAREAIEKKQFDRAQAMIDLAQPIVDRTRDTDLREYATALEQDFLLAREWWPRVVEAEATLKADPENAAANAVYGRYLCLDRDDWESGIALLAKGDDLATKELALRDAENPRKHAEQLAMADAWYAFGLADGKNLGYLRRAKYWYQDAYEWLRGVDAKTASDRIAQIDRLLVSQTLVSPEESNAKDLWAGNGSGTVPASPTEFGHSPVNMFGGAVGLRRQPIDRGATLFAKAPGGTVQSVDFMTARPVRIGRIDVHLRHDPDGKRAARAIRILAYDPAVRNFVKILEHDLAMPYRATPQTQTITIEKAIEPNELKLSAKIRPGIATQFRAEFVLAGEPDEEVDGVRVVELDAYDD